MSLKWDAQNADTYLALGHAYTSKGQQMKANTCLQKALQINPSLNGIHQCGTADQKDLEGYLKEAKGRNSCRRKPGTRTRLYASYGLNVVWIEPSGCVCKLKTLIASFLFRGRFVFGYGYR